MSWRDFIGGNEKAFEQIYREHIDDLFAYGVKFHADRELVLDCIHDLFIRLFNNTKIAKDVQVKYYLFSSLRRQLLKTKYNHQTVEISQLPEDLLWTASHELQWIEREEQDLNFTLLKEKIDLLPKRQKEVLFLKYYMDFDYEQISDLMQVSVESCRTLSYRALKQLKSELAPAEFLILINFYFFLVKASMF
ncbi:RNA polymerase sigma factor [Sphingobacterium sp. LRF_L2]|uniref:RNA polymerase sigma factor n=1 Tax=Sphingobacterium sp. LRF_L2 TaxID=3369421 RepID=UPI003F5FE224